MNPKKLALILVTVSLAAILSVSYVHAQTPSVGSYNSTSNSNNTMTTNDTYNLSGSSGNLTNGASHQTNSTITTNSTTNSIVATNSTSTKPVQTNSTSSGSATTLLKTNANFTNSALTSSSNNATITQNTTMINSTSVNSISATNSSNTTSNMVNSTSIDNSNVTSTGQLSDSCWNSLRHQVKNTISPFNETRAKGLASSDTDFGSHIQGYKTKFDGEFNTWHIDKANCAVTWRTTNLVYHLYNSTGGFVKNVIVTEDPISTSILNVTEQNIQIKNLQDNSTIWSGYEFTGDGNNPHTSTMEYSYTTFIVPAVSVPSYPSTNTCYGTQNQIGTCNLAIWAGLEHHLGGGEFDLAQSGATANIACNTSNCNTVYFLWYEFLPDNPVQCPAGVYINASDQISVSVYLDILNGGTDASKVDIMTSDSQNSNAFCTYSHSYFNSTSPYYSSFITESASTTPQFNNVDMVSNTVYYNGAYHFVTDPYSNGWYYEWNFFNPSVTSINNSPISSSNHDFTETWNPLCYPTSGTWTVSQTCTFWSGNGNVQGSVIIPNSVTLRIPFGQILTIDFTHYNLKVNWGGTLLIDGGNHTGGKIN